jgi:type VI secretion system protein ImpL
VLPLLQQLRNTPVGYGNRSAPTRNGSRIRPEPARPTAIVIEAAYHTALERLFRPRLLYRLEEQLNARITEPAFVYEALKVYLMLGGLHPPDKASDQVLDAARLGRQSLSGPDQFGGTQAA